MFFVEDHISFKIMAIVTFLLMNVCLFFTGSNDSYMGAIILYGVFFTLGAIYVKSWNAVEAVPHHVLRRCGHIGGDTGVSCSGRQSRARGSSSRRHLMGRRVLWGGGFLAVVVWNVREDAA